MRRIGTLLLCLTSLFPGSAYGDSLGSLRSDVRTPEPESPREPDPSKKEKKKAQDDSWFNNNHCDCDDDDNSEFWSAMFYGAGIVATSPFWGPHGMLEHSRVGEGYFAAYPYECTPGSMLFDDLLSDEAPPGGFPWLERLRGEYADEFDDLSRYSGHLLVDTSSRLGFDTEVNYWRQSLSPGVHDQLWLGDANLLYRFAQNEFVQMRSGVGLNWLADDIGSEFGFNFTYGGDIYPIRPLVVSADLDAGWLGEAWLIHLRATVGVQWKQVEVYTGYDYWEIGSTQLDGLIAGVRLTF
jgi:hypothetical protein